MLRCSIVVLIFFFSNSAKCMNRLFSNIEVKINERPRLLAREKNFLSNNCKFFNTHTYIMSLMTRLAIYVAIFIKALIRYLCSY